MQREQELTKKYLKEAFDEIHAYTEVVLGSYSNRKKDKLYNPAKYRIDAIVHKPGIIYLIETKLKPSPSAIGQLLFYKELFRETPEFREWWDLFVRLVFLTTERNLKLKKVCRDVGIDYVVFNPF